MRIWVNFSYTWIDSASHSLPLFEGIWLADLPPKSFAQIHEWLIGWLRKIGTRRAPTNDKWSYTPSSGVKTPVVTQVWGHLYGLQTSLVTGKGPPCRLILPDLSVKVGIHDVLGVTHLEFLKTKAAKGRYILLINHWPSQKKHLWHWKTCSLKLSFGDDSKKETTYDF